MTNILKSNRAPKYLSPKYDMGFKNSFGNPKHKGLLIKLLNTIIKSKDPIQDLEYLPEEANSLGRDGKRSVCDVRCKLTSGTHIIIEVQLKHEEFFNERVIYEACVEIATQLEKSSEEHDIVYQLEPVYVVSIVHFNRFHDDSYLKQNEILYEYTLTETESKEPLANVLHFYFLELNNFKKSLSDLGTFEEKVYFCLKNMGNLNSKPPVFEGDFFEELFKVMEFKSLTIKQQEEYLLTMTTEEKHQRQMAYVVNKAAREVKEAKEALEAAKEALETAKEAAKEASEKAQKEGFDKGIEQSTNSIVKKMIQEGIEPSIISKITGYSSEQIESVKCSLD